MGPAANEITLIHFNDVYNVESRDQVGQELLSLLLQWSAVRVTPSGNPRDLNFSRTVAGITKWFWLTTEGYLSYLLPKFKDLIPTSLGDRAI